RDLGLAFQIVDDLLDLVGDPRVTGKTPGTDLKEGVFTLPVLLAVEREPALAGALERGERDLETVLPVLASTGALDEARGEARRLGAAAVESARRSGSGEFVDVLTTIVTGVEAQLPTAF
ncbi:MAG TPA: polyprenyl synthetase family protein, partial [Actinomycetota bacterium]|nr:polyprenyl synthetase family protein [Actinomycetota bacterium]